jgi:hypothetical protein
MKHNINVIQSVWRRWRKTKPRHTRRVLLAKLTKHDDGAVIEHARHNDQRCDGPNVNYAMYEAGRETKRKARKLDSKGWNGLTQTLHSAVPQATCSNIGAETR